MAALCSLALSRNAAIIELRLFGLKICHSLMAHVPSWRHPWRQPCDGCVLDGSDVEGAAAVGTGWPVETSGTDHGGR